MNDKSALILILHIKKFFGSNIINFYNSYRLSQSQQILLMAKQVELWFLIQNLLNLIILNNWLSFLNFKLFITKIIVSFYQRIRFHFFYLVQCIINNLIHIHFITKPTLYFLKSISLNSAHCLHNLAFT